MNRQAERDPLQVARRVWALLRLLVTLARCAWILTRVGVHCATLPARVVGRRWVRDVCDGDLALVFAATFVLATVTIGGVVIVLAALGRFP